MSTTRTWSGERLKQLRLRKGWSQDQLARVVPTGVRNIVRYESNANTPGANMVARLARALDVDEGAFFENGDPDDDDDEDEPMTEMDRDLILALRTWAGARTT